MSISLRYTMAVGLFCLTMSPSFLPHSQAKEYVSKATSSYQQKISGKVIDENAAAIVGAAVKNLTNNKIVQTNASGEFAINGNLGDRISINFLGYLTQEVQLTQNNQSITLVNSENEIEEVTVSIGYQKIRKSDVTGAIASVKAEELNLTSPKLGLALVGKVAGNPVISAPAIFSCCRTCSKNRF